MAGEGESDDGEDNEVGAACEVYGLGWEVSGCRRAFFIGGGRKGLPVSLSNLRL